MQTRHSSDLSPYHPRASYVRILTKERAKKTLMDKIFSTRLDESVIVELERVTKRHGMTKKQLVEQAIQERARQLTVGESSSGWTETFGAWNRKETAAQTVNKTRNQFHRTFRGEHS